MKLLHDPEMIRYHDRTEHKEYKILVERGDVILALKTGWIHDSTLNEAWRLDNDTHFIFLESIKVSIYWFHLLCLSPERKIRIFCINAADHTRDAIIPLELFDNPNSHWKYHTDSVSFHFETPLRYEQSEGIKR